MSFFIISSVETARQGSKVVFVKNDKVFDQKIVNITIFKQWRQFVYFDASAFSNKMSFKVYVFEVGFFFFVLSTCTDSVFHMVNHVTMTDL